MKVIESVNDDVIRSSQLEDDRMYNILTQDIEPYLKNAKAIRDASPEHGKYRKETFGCVYACTIPSAIVEQMANGQCCTDGKRYNLMSNEKEEWRRALVHIQTCHKDLLTVKGKPFAKDRPKWQ